MHERSESRAREWVCSNFDLSNIHFLVLFLHLLHSQFHGIDCQFGVLQLLSGEIGLLHVERLVPQTLQLLFVHPLLLQHSQCSLLHHVLEEEEEEEGREGRDGGGRKREKKKAGKE